jgi:dethiobiotin synthetase
VSLFVTGTGTEVGKTVVSALLLARYPGASYWKPVATGSRLDRDTATVGGLVPETEILPESYLFAEPLSPHLAARLEGARIDPARLLADFAHYRGRPRDRPLVVEGAGGLLVPLDDNGFLIADLIAALELPSLVVAHSGLGTINHTLLTLEALRRRDLPVAGIVLNGPRNPENRRALERLGGVEVIAEIESFPLTPDDLAAMARGFDLEGRLRPFLKRP